MLNNKVTKQLTNEVELIIYKYYIIKLRRYVSFTKEECYGFVQVKLIFIDYTIYELFQYRKSTNLIFSNENYSCFYVKWS